MWLLKWIANLARDVPFDAEVRGQRSEVRGQMFTRHYALSTRHHGTTRGLGERARRGHFGFRIVDCGFEKAEGKEQCTLRISQLSSGILLKCFNQFYLFVFNDKCELRIAKCEMTIGKMFSLNYQRERENR